MNKITETITEIKQLYCQDNIPWIIGCSWGKDSTTTNQLVDIQAVRGLIKRSFSNQSSAVIGELLQNAQRSGASEIRFEIENNRIIVTDNGSGIKDFAALLILGKSEYKPEVVENQHPMGVGFNSLLAHDEIKTA